MALPATVRIALMEPRVPWAEVRQPFRVVVGTGAGMAAQAAAGLAAASCARRSSAGPPPQMDGGFTLPLRSVVARSVYRPRPAAPICGWVWQAWQLVTFLWVPPTSGVQNSSPKARPTRARRCWKLLLPLSPNSGWRRPRLIRYEIWFSIGAGSCSDAKAASRSACVKWMSLRCPGPWVGLGAFVGLDESTRNG